MNKQAADIVLIGAGAMSTCLGTLLNQLDPSLKITMIERLDQVAMESTDVLNNAGTGHAGYCELNYTPESEDGTIDISKALEINAAFEVSLQFWSTLVDKGVLPEPTKFINPVPQQSFVWGEDNVEFLRKRYKLLSKQHQFADMEFSDDPEVIREWLPLVMENRTENEKVAATRIAYGSDVNFGQIAKSMTNYLIKQEGFELYLNTNVDDLTQQEDGTWDVLMRDRESDTKTTINAKFVFLGVGGGALPLLQKSGIPEGDGYAGFPVSGQWLICDKPEIVQKHRAKVYGKAAVDAPPMSVPHLDTRVLSSDATSSDNLDSLDNLDSSENSDNIQNKALLFGPFAGFTTKFLKYGSNFDLIKSTNFDNIKPMAMVGLRNIDLTRYLISESMQSHSDRVKSLRNYYPDAKEEDWTLASAGQRVQIIKKCEDQGGTLEFGTEVVTSADGSLAALLGASPGASITVKTMIEILESCFKDQYINGNWQAKIKEMIPSYQESLINNVDLLKKVRSRTLSVLKLVK
jgi:malate dehydrogenase (quinone)